MQRFIWHRNFGPLVFGLDLATWGLGFMQAFRYPRGAAFHLGPFYLTIEGHDLDEWAGRSLDRLGDRIEAWHDRREAKKTAKWAKKLKYLRGD